MSLSRGLWFRKEERGPWVWGWVFFRGGHYSSRLMFIWRISTCFRGVINPQVEEKSIEFCDVFHFSIKWIVPALLQGVIVLWYKSLLDLICAGCTTESQIAQTVSSVTQVSQTERNCYLHCTWILNVVHSPFPRPSADRSMIGSCDNCVKTKDVISRFKDRFWNVMLVMFYLNLFCLPTLKQVGRHCKMSNQVMFWFTQMMRFNV